MQTSVSKEVEFDAGHRVPNHLSKCCNPHGHRYRVRATCTGEVTDDHAAPDDGMVVDFGDLKAWLTEHVHDRFDHGFIVDTRDTPMLQALTMLDRSKVITVPYVPTAENLARDIFDTLAVLITDGWGHRLKLTRVDVWETPTSVASVTA